MAANNISFLQTVFENVRMATIEYAQNYERQDSWVAQNWVPPINPLDLLKTGHE